MAKGGDARRFLLSYNRTNAVTVTMGHTGTISAAMRVLKSARGATTRVEVCAQLSGGYWFT